MNLGDFLLWQQRLLERGLPGVGAPPEKTIRRMADGLAEVLRRNTIAGRSSELRVGLARGSVEAALNGLLPAMMVERAVRLGAQEDRDRLVARYEEKLRTAAPQRLQRAVHLIHVAQVDLILALAGSPAIAPRWLVVMGIPATAFLAVYWLGPRLLVVVAFAAIIAAIVLWSEAQASAPLERERDLASRLAASERLAPELFGIEEAAPPIVVSVAESFVYVGPPGLGGPLAATIEAHARRSSYAEGDVRFVIPLPAVGDEHDWTIECYGTFDGSRLVLSSCVFAPA
jgi:hypothetical protein